MRKRLFHLGLGRPCHPFNARKYQASPRANHEDRQRSVVRRYRGEQLTTERATDKESTDE